MQHSWNMKLAHLLFSVASLLWLRFTHAKIGYFWHITDLHYDLFHNSPDILRGCRHGNEHGQRNRHRTEHVCDSSWKLIESAAAVMKDRHPDTLEFVLWTGDILSSTMDHMSDEFRLGVIKNVTDLLSRTFSSQFVFPALGHNDPPPSKKLADMWSQWLPSDALKTFETGGYYTIEKTYTKLKIVTLNSALWSGGATRGAAEGPHRARAQWDWLEKVLNTARRNQEVVYLVAHAGPGVEERNGAGATINSGDLSPVANARLLHFTRIFSDVIVGQFYGHAHADTFRIVYNGDRDRPKPVSWMFLAPSLSPRSSGSITNPGLRLYKYDTNNGKILDYTQYYLDVSSPKVEAHWTIEYNLTQYYGLREVSANSLHALAERLRSPNDHGLFAKYMMARTVRYSAADGAWECDAACVHSHFCAITKPDYSEYRLCVRSPASALASLASTHLDKQLVLVIAILAVFMVFRLPT